MYPPSGRTRRILTMMILAMPRWLCDFMIILGLHLFGHDFFQISRCCSCRQPSKMGALVVVSLGWKFETALAFVQDIKEDWA